MRAKVAHQPAGSNPTLLSFSKGEMVTVLVQQPKNGWLYGCAEGGSCQGWFPASYVEAVDDPVNSSSSRNLTARSKSSMSSLFDQPASSSNSRAPPPPPPPPSQSSSRPETQLFPRGTNPFATVKLKPTSTNDRSAPRLHRR